MINVLAGPDEATVMGNIGVAFYALGEIKDFEQLRRVTAASTDLKQYDPQDNEAWEKAYKDYVKIL